MNEIGCEVYIEGSQAEGSYYTNCDNIKYLGNKLQNYGSSNIILYRLEQTTQSQFNPYILVQAYKYPRYYSSQTQSQYIELTNITKVSFNPLGYFYHYRSWLDSGLIFAVFILLVLSLVKKG